MNLEQEKKGGDRMMHGSVWSAQRCMTKLGGSSGLEQQGDYMSELKCIVRAVLELQVRSEVAQERLAVRTCGADSRN